MPRADIARHFPYGGKIKRIYVTAEQLTALNAGELGVVQLNGRYLLVTAEVLAQCEAVFAPSVALKVDPNAPAEEDPGTRTRSTRCRTTWSGNCICRMMKTPGPARRFVTGRTQFCGARVSAAGSARRSRAGRRSGQPASRQECGAAIVDLHSWPAISAPSTPPTPDENHRATSGRGH